MGVIKSYSDKIAIVTKNSSSSLAGYIVLTL